ncbi:MAG: hypothetical protein JWM16_6309 [Verrucomicrobiales bacterium]|nr:hypothetical protein [Verrucomicrobiales bacterium]
MSDKPTHYGYDFWLVFDCFGKVRQTVREPGIGRDERKMFVRASLPKSLWSSPALRATITVTADNNEPKFVLDLQAAVQQRGKHPPHAHSAQQGPSRKRAMPAVH